MFQPALVLNIIQFCFSFKKYNKHVSICFTGSHAIPRITPALGNKINATVTCIELFCYFDFYTLTLLFVLLSGF